MQQKYRVWLMEPIIDTHTDNDYHTTSDLRLVIGTPYGMQDRIVSQEELDLLRAALYRMNRYERPLICYQPLDVDPNVVVDNLLKAGVAAQEEERKRLEKLAETTRKRNESMQKRKKEKELKKLAALQEKYGKTK